MYFEVDNDDKQDQNADAVNINIKKLQSKMDKQNPKGKTAQPTKPTPPSSQDSKDKKAAKTANLNSNITPTPQGGKAQFDAAKKKPGATTQGPTKNDTKL